MTPKQNKLKAPSGGVSGFFRRLWAYLVFCCIGIRANFKEIFTFHKKFDLKSKLNVAPIILYSIVVK